MITKELGIPIEYEVNIVSGTKVNVDLVSINTIEKVVYIIEVKGKIGKDKDYYDTPETLLRCALEIETYFESLEKYQEKVIKDIFEFRKISENPQEYSLKKAILVPNESFAAKQINSDEYKNVNAVLRKFDIKTCCFDNEIHKKRKW